MAASLPPALDGDATQPPGEGEGEGEGSQVGLSRPGWIFLFNASTESEVFARSLVGAPSDHGHGDPYSNWSRVRQVQTGDSLFLYNTTTKHLTGVFQAVAPGGLNLVPDACGGQFPAQVHVQPRRGHPAPTSLPLSAAKALLPWRSNGKFALTLQPPQRAALEALFFASSGGVRERSRSPSPSPHKRLCTAEAELVLAPPSTTAEDEDFLPLPADDSPPPSPPPHRHLNPRRRRMAKRRVPKNMDGVAGEGTTQSSAVALDSGSSILPLSLLPSTWRVLTDDNGVRRVATTETPSDSEGEMQAAILTLLRTGRGRAKRSSIRFLSGKLGGCLPNLSAGRAKLGPVTKFIKARPHLFCVVRRDEKDYVELVGGPPVWWSDTIHSEQKVAGDE